MARKRVTVTQNHIDAGTAGDIFSCPVALALKERVAGPVVVVGLWWRYSDGVFTRRALTPRVARWINDFDNGKPMQPFIFMTELD